MGAGLDFGLIVDLGFDSGTGLSVGLGSGFGRGCFFIRRSPCRSFGDEFFGFGFGFGSVSVHPLVVTSAIGVRSHDPAGRFRSRMASAASGALSNSVSPATRPISERVRRAAGP